RERSARPTTLVAPLLFATNPFVAYHAVAGLETPLHVALIATAALSILELERHPRLAFPLLLLSLALTPWSRPESFGYAGALLVAGGVLHRDRPGPPTSCFSPRWRARWSSRSRCAGTGCIRSASWCRPLRSSRR